MRTKGKPKITEKADKRGKEWTQITFKPDFKRFGMPDGLDDDIESLFMKRVHDSACLLCTASGCGMTLHTVAGTVRDCKVYLNGKQLHIKDFKAYVSMYANAAAAVATANGNALAGASLDGSAAGSKPSIIYERFGDRWEVGFAVSDGQFQQVSFVNSIATTKGGSHVDHVSKQIVEGLVEVVKKKNKNAPVKAHQVCLAI